MKTMQLTASMLTLALTMLVPANAQATSKNDLVRCGETGYVGSSADSCGGDNLTKGIIQVSATGKVSVTVTGALADPYSLYEVYWLHTGEIASDAHLIGNFVTDCNGDSIKNSGTAGPALLKTIDQASDIKSTAYANIYSLVGNASSGVFLVYNRGPYSYDPNVSAPCNPKTLTEYNTTSSPNDTGSAKATTPFANPSVVADYRIQFMSGYHN